MFLLNIISKDEVDSKQVRVFVEKFSMLSWFKIFRKTR